MVAGRREAEHRGPGYLSLAPGHTQQGPYFYTRYSPVDTYTYIDRAIDK